MTAVDKYLSYNGLLLPTVAHSPGSLRYAERFQFVEDDVVAVTYPKSGTTWMQEILPLVLSGGDLSSVQNQPNWDRVPWLEETRAALVLEGRPSPRAMVTHLPLPLMPASFFKAKPKVIYVTRNPKDVVVSSFHFHQMASFLDDPGTFDEFLDKFLAGEVLFGKWTDHVKSWRSPEVQDRILYITYEEMLEDLRGAVLKFSQFLGKELGEETLTHIAEQCSFSNMKQNKMSNYSLVPTEFMDTSKSHFLRKGVAGDWKNYFSPEQEARFLAVYREEMKGVDFKSSWDEN